MSNIQYSIARSIGRIFISAGAFALMLSLPIPGQTGDRVLNLAIGFSVCGIGLLLFPKELKS